MSEHEYNVIRRTLLRQFPGLPADLQRRYLDTCPRSIRAALLRLLAN